MITIILSNCPPSLRGFLTRWLIEVSTGVYVGKVNSRLREKIWEIVLEEVGNGRAIMTYPDHSKEQGFSILMHNHEWSTADIDGLDLILRPTAKNNARAPRGWSRASHRRRSRHH
ncbi:type I-E CRISPR-associated endoribonuclease Cas2e [Corynebacterium sp. CCM 8835]|uniref:Type I-E CRISPR-associated endoribonuclease Cas2 n=1 Tax=Corynebacterium antarcticum TaxID=2800405 RepID=A0A9Q4GLE0_9CORY|nr:type I-E CRISPR-associated endoribonuclease Cas2e [Corynebacterium antarcticum]MCK7642061.1 type I-E CRISPR-associated endoribonuclease Cas2e [Corynebacterium antarcticum]MCK7659839.1 type I-E CRISPR-associated endoribonuclease Cas2e [Corynebacterium antarcticum]MCL0245286.1 type I-E CRISPR-associated endoribonuclease Cas2e [Corynebacterium antarcticum]MCX7537683.1 type I-E CRISPR-associated endoribonuclease Cas2e [Corynebacterium antarcticum]MCX7539165.1 type I-E CRISPR-associated endoribo